MSVAVLIALGAGIALGALGVLFAVRPALLERRRRIDEVIVLERALAETRAELAAGRNVVDERLEAAI